MEYKEPCGIMPRQHLQLPAIGNLKQSLVLNDAIITLNISVSSFTYLSILIVSRLSSAGLEFL